LPSNGEKFSKWLLGKAGMVIVNMGLDGDNVKELVSVVVPVYNMENYIEKSLDALCRQTYRNMEIIVVNDASTDSTLEKCLKFAQENDNVRVINLETNSGSGNARNVGIESAKGEWIYFPDADDVMEETMIEQLVSVADKTKCDLVVFGYQVYDGYGNKLFIKSYEDTIIPGDLIREHYELYLGTEGDRFKIQGAPWNKFFNLSLIKEKNIIYPDLRRHQDEVFIARYMKYANIVCFSKLILYTWHTNSIADRAKKIPNGYFDIIHEMYKYLKEIITDFNSDNLTAINDVDKIGISSYLFALETYEERLKLREYRQLVKKYLLDTGMVQNVRAKDAYRKLTLFFIRHKMYLLSKIIIKIKVFSMEHFSGILSRLVRQRRAAA
jgi:glycosyltransferase involved in cell wall biosynthesis